MHHSEIEQLIKNLVCQYDCVCIPNFGSLISSTENSSVDLVAGTISPSFRNISFNRNLQKNDALLANAISEKRACSYNASILLIDRFVAHINKELETNASYHLAGIGAFNLVDSERIVFKKSAAALTSKSAFGLQTIAFENNIAPEKKEAVEAISEEKLVSETQTFSKEKNTKRELRKQNKEVKKSKKNYALLLVLAALLVVSQLILWDVQPKGMELSSLNLLHYNPVAEINAGTKSPSLAAEIQPKIEAKDYLAIPKIQDSRIETGYYIVLGSFSKWKYANNLRKKLALNGFEAELIRNENDLIRVVLSAGQFQEQAIDNLSFFQSSWNVDAWVLENSI